uniref:polynucleotide adenylyltransferase n=1 Tax=Meloidogyne incognita TaxID=6306 RepID=A0A914L6T7_MELIC
MRYMKIWAKNRLIYSNIAGYLSGHSLSIMSAKICIEFPEATSLSFVIKQFFKLYNSWNWGEEPLFLVDLIDTNEVFENASTIVEPWRWVKNDDSSSETGSSEKRGTNEGNNGTQMSIITPGFPEQNTTFNVNKFTLKMIVGEIEIGK